MAVLIPTISGHRAQQGALLRQAQARQASLIPLGSGGEVVPAALLGVDPPGQAVASQVPAHRIAAQEEAMRQSPVLEESPPLRTAEVDTLDDDSPA